MKYYSLDRILSYNADYNIIFGERSNGKTTSVLMYIVEEFIKSGYKNQGAIVRRWEEDFKGGKDKQLFSVVVSLGLVEKYSKGTYNNIICRSKKWYLCKIDDEGKIDNICDTPLAFSFSVGSEEHYKSSAYPFIKTILFDEMITRTGYLPNEFILFQNLLSTIIRDRDDIKIFMLGNTINKYCPYFAEMGLNKVKNMEEGTIDIYSYGDSNLKVAVERTSSSPSKKSNKYFAFNNNKLKMITKGQWEIDIYPHLPVKYGRDNILYMFFVTFESEILQCEIIEVGYNLFIYAHRKTTPIDDNKGDYLVYQQDYDSRPNYRRNILKSMTKLESKIYTLINNDRIYYQDNEVGEIFRNYLLWCAKNS